MRRFAQVFGGIMMLIAMPLWSQMDETGNASAPTAAGYDNSDDRMLTPPPVSGESYPTAFTTEERSNYLRGEVAFTSAYSDNVLGSAADHTVSDVSYSIAPGVTMDTKTSRLHWLLTYAPGFTFYQRTSTRNEADHNVLIDFHYRLSPHVTVTANDKLQRSSSAFNRPDLTTAAVSGGTQGPNFSVIAPIADHLNNDGNITLTYQFSQSGMIGASATFSNLHYPNPTEVVGLYDAGSHTGSAFYSLRISKKHYVGVTYRYQRLVSYLTAGADVTHTHAILFFYTLYATPACSISFFGGPQYSNAALPPLSPSLLQLPAAREWTPSAGTSVSWQGRLNTLAMSYSHTISGGGGLAGAAHMDSATASLRQQMTKSLSALIDGAYFQNNLLGGMFPGATNGHSISGTASLQQQIGPHLSLQLGYTRLHQSYTNLPVISQFPDTNREFILLSYQFSRPQGR